MTKMMQNVHYLPINPCITTFLPRVVGGILLAILLSSCATTSTTITEYSGQPSELFQERRNYASPVKRVIIDETGQYTHVTTAYLDREQRSIVFFTEDRLKGELERHKVLYDSSGKLLEIQLLDESDEIRERISLVITNPLEVNMQLSKVILGTTTDSTVTERLAFDESGRLRVRWFSIGESDREDHRVEYSYDDDGALISKKVMHKQSLETIVYQRDSGGRTVVAERDLGADETIDFYERYTYDDEGNLITITRKDSEDRLVSTEKIEYQRYDQPVFSPTMFAGSGLPAIRRFSFDLGYPESARTVY